MGRGGLMQLISYGTQDKILMENPQITFFKHVYKKPTLFSIEQIERPVDLSNIQSCGSSNTRNITIPNYGDLLKNLDLKFELPSIKFDYKEKLIDVVKKNINNKNYANNFEAYYYNISKLELLELILYNYIIYTARLPSASGTYEASETVKYNILNEINSLHKSLNGTIILQPDKFNLIYNEIELEDLLINDTANLSSDYNASEYINDNKVLSNVINQTNGATLLTSEEINSLNASLDTSEITILPGNNILNYGLRFVKNIKLQICDIMMQNYDTYISYYNISTYFNNYAETGQENKQINQYYNIYNNLITSLTYGVVSNDELYSYNSIISAAPSDIKTLNLTNYNTFVINTEAIYYEFPIMIVVGSNYSSIDVLEIKSILQIIKIKTDTNNKSMLTYGILLNNDYDNIDNSCFITCSASPDSLINYSNYYLIYNVYSLSSSSNQQVNNDIYVFQIKGDYTTSFIKNKLSYIFNDILSTSPYNYLYNNIDTDKYYKPVAVFLINTSTYDTKSNLTTIITSKIIYAQSITLDDNIFIKNNVVLNINDILVSSKNTDVVTNYNSYINSSNIVGQSDDEIITNLQKILSGTIKYNTGYISNLYNNIFNQLSYFFHIIEIGYDSTSGLFSSYQKYQNTYLGTILDFLLNTIIDATYPGSFLYRDPNDLYYNNLYNRFKTILYKMVEDYRTIVYNYNFKFFNYSNDKINTLFNTISKLTTDYGYNPIYNPQNLSNIYINKRIGLGSEFCILKSDKPLSNGTKIDVKTNQFTLNTYINDNSNSLQQIQYNKQDIFRNITFTDITYIMARYGTLYVVDNYTTVYIINQTYNNLFTNKNVKNLQLLNDVIPWSPAIYSYNCSLYNIISNNLFHKKYLIDKVNNSTNNIFYVTELNNIIQLEQHISFKPINICTIQNTLNTNAIKETIIDDKLYFVNGLFTNYTSNTPSLFNCFVNINNISKYNINLLNSALSKSINYSLLSNILYFNGFIIIIDITNYCVYIYNETTLQSDIIDFSFILYGYSSIPSSESIFCCNRSVYNLINANISNGYLYLYLYNADNLKYYFTIFNLSIVSTSNNMIDSTLKLYTDGLIEVVQDGNFADYPKKIEFFNNFCIYIYNSRIYYNNNIISNTRQFEDVVKLMVYNTSYVVIYMNNINTIKIYLTGEFFSTTPTENIICKTITSDNNDWLVNGIQYMWIDSVSNLYVGSNNNIHKIFISTSGPTIKYKFINTIIIEQSYETVINGSISGASNYIYIATTSQVLKYDYLTFTPEYNILPSSYYYSYNIVDITFNNYYNTFLLIDRIQNRIIYGDYKLEFDILIFNNINSINLVSVPSNTMPIKYIQNKLNGFDYSQTIIIIIDNVFNILKYSNNYYIVTNNFADTSSNTLIDIIYNKDVIKFLNYDSSNNLFLNKIQDTLDNFDIFDYTHPQISDITNLSYNSNIIYGIESDDNYDYLKIGNTGYVQIQRLTETTGMTGMTGITGMTGYIEYLNTDLFIGNGLFGATGYNYTLPTNNKNVYLNNIKSLYVLPSDDLIIHNNSDLYYVNNENTIKLNVDFGYTGYVANTGYLGISGPTSSIPTYNNGVSLWYTPPDYVSNQSYNVISQSAYNNHIYVLTNIKNGATGPGSVGYKVNYINTNSQTKIQYDVIGTLGNTGPEPIGITGSTGPIGATGLNYITDPINIYTLRSIGLDDWLAFSSNKNVYLYKLNHLTNKFEWKSTVSCATNIKSVAFSKSSLIVDQTNQYYGDIYPNGFVYTKQLQSIPDPLDPTGPPINYFVNVLEPTNKFDVIFNYMMYILPIANTTYDNNDVIQAFFLHTNGFPSIASKSYVKPYYTSNKLIDTSTIKNPDINHPYLFYIDILDEGTTGITGTTGTTGMTGIGPTYAEYLLGNECSQINILEIKNRIPFLVGLTGITGMTGNIGSSGSYGYTGPQPNDLFLYEIEYEYVLGTTGPTGVNYPKYINDVIEQSRSDMNGNNLKFSYNNDPNFNIKLMFKYNIIPNNNSGVAPQGPILYTYYNKYVWLNNFNLDIGYFDSFSTEIDVYQVNYYNHILDNNPIFYRVEGYYYFSQHPKNRYMLDQHQVIFGGTDYQSPNFVYDDTNNIISYSTYFSYNNQDYYKQYETFVINIDYNDYLILTSTYQRRDVWSLIFGDITIKQITEPITIITRTNLYVGININILSLDKTLTNGNYMDGSTKYCYAFKIFYNIDPITTITLKDYLHIPTNNFWQLSDYIYIKYKNEYTIGRYGIYDSKSYLIVYYKLLVRMNWYDKYSLTSGNISNQDLYNSNPIPYDSLTVLQKVQDPTTFYPILPSTQLPNFFNANVIILDYIEYIANVFIDVNSTNIIYGIYQTELYDIINNILVSTSNLIYNNDNSIIVGDVDGIVYPKIQANNTSNSLYLKISNNFDNLVGYKAINNKISTSINQKSLKNYYKYISILFLNYNDYIIKQLKIISKRPSQSDFLDWTSIDTYTIEQTVQFIYLYLKKMIELSTSPADYINFTGQTINDSVKYLINNIYNFETIYDEVASTYLLTEWNTIKLCILNLYYDISNIGNLLNNNSCVINGIKYILLLKNFNSNVPIINNIIYLEDQTDATVLTYTAIVLDSIFNNYQFNDLLKLQQNVIDLYFNNLNILFNNDDIGTTTYSTINNITLLYDLNMNNINVNKYTIPNNNYNPFILPFSYNIYNIQYITSYLTSRTNKFSDRLTYYIDNKNILQLAKLKYEDVLQKYIEYTELKQNNPITCLNTNTNPIINGTLNGISVATLQVSAIYDVKINDFIGFYSNTDEYNVHKVVAINYRTNTVNYGPPPPYNVQTPPQNNIPITITIDALFPTISSTNKIIYYGIDTLQLNDYSLSLYSSINIRNTICYIIFNNFLKFDNIYYDNYDATGYISDAKYNYWYFYSNNLIKYFTVCPGKNSYQGTFDNYYIDYPNYLYNNMNLTYKIKDISLLSTIFSKIFSIQTELYTVDNIIYKFSQLINHSNVNNITYYSLIYFIHSMTIMINNNFDFKTLFDINNIEILISKLNQPTITDINSILTLISQTNDKSLYKFNVFSINNYPLDSAPTTSNNMVLSNNLIHSFVYPYINFDTNMNFNIDSALRNKCITVAIKFNDINTIIHNITEYYNNSTVLLIPMATYLTQSIVDIMFYDRFTKDIAINKTKSITLLNNSDKFNLYDGIQLSDPMLTTNIIVNSVSYIFNNNIVNILDTNLYYNNVVIDAVERINYVRLKIQQLLIWYLGTISDPNNQMHYLYYNKLPENMMYNYDTDNINTLDDSQITTIIDSLHSYLNCPTINIIVDNITPSSLYYGNINVSNILYIIDDMKSITNFNEFTNMVSPCNYYYVAYFILKLINDHDDLTINNTFVYNTEPIKCNYVPTIRNYTKKQIEFLKSQQKIKTFMMENWIGQIDGVDKVQLTNHTLLYTYINNIPNYLLNSQTFVDCLASLSNIAPNIYIINYILMTIFNTNGNHIESHYRTNTSLLMKYPTLYLVNGRLVRTTNLPNYYYYDVINDISNTVNYLTINKISLNDQVSGRIMYNVVQNSINKTINYITTNFDEYYNSNNFIAQNKYDIKIATDIPLLYINNSINNYMNYNYNATVDTVSNYFVVPTVPISGFTHPIIFNTYIYLTHLSNIYYCFITHSFENKIYYDVGLSDNILLLNGLTNVGLYGGLYNIINKLYNNRRYQYISATNILDRYDEWSILSQKIINYMGTYYGKRYDNDALKNEYIILYDSAYFTRLITDMINDTKTLKIDSNNSISNFITSTDLFSIQQNYNLDVNESITLYKKILSSLNINIDDYNGIVRENNKGHKNSPSMNYILDACNYPYNIYDVRPATGNWIKYLGHYILDYIEFFIGSESIQKITDDFLHINYGLTIDPQKNKQYLNNIGYTRDMLLPANSIDGKTIYLFIPWFFNKSTHNLPLISLINTKTYVSIKMKDIDDLIIHDDFVKVNILDSKNKISSNTNIKTMMLMDYIYLDTEERNKFISLRHEYLIEQQQYLTPTVINQDGLLNGSTINLNFNNCIKDMYWFAITKTNIDAKDYGNYTVSPSSYNGILNGIENIILFKDDIKIKNIIERVYDRMVSLYGNNVDINKINISWFNKSELASIQQMLTNILEYDRNIPILNNQIVINGKILLDRDSLYNTTVLPFQKYNNNPNNGLNVYSFSLNPQEGQPSGSLNFSAIKRNDIKLNVRMDEKIGITNNMVIVKVISRSYNILRIFSGMGACIYNM